MSNQTAKPKTAPAPAAEIEMHARLRERAFLISTVARFAARLGMRTTLYRLKPGEHTSQRDCAAWRMQITIDSAVGQLAWYVDEVYAPLFAGLLPAMTRPPFTDDAAAVASACEDWAKALITMLPAGLREELDVNPWDGAAPGTRQMERMQDSL